MAKNRSVGGVEADGIVHRDAQPVIPPRVDYSLTERGSELVGHLLPLFGWSWRCRRASSERA